MKNIGIGIVVVLLVAIAFWGGTVWTDAGSSDQVAETLPGARAADGTGRPAMGNLTEEQMAEMQNMTQEERQTFMQEQGIEAPSGGQGGTRGGLLEGEVLDIADDSLTIALESGGSQTIYVDDDTVVAYTEDAGNLTSGTQVMLMSESEADGVAVASLVVVK